MDDLDAINRVLGRALELRFFDRAFFSRVLGELSAVPAAIDRAIARQVRYAANARDPRTIDIAAVLAAAIVTETPYGRGEIKPRVQIRE